LFACFKLEQSDLFKHTDPQTNRLEMGPDPTRAYFWPAVNKRLTCLRPWYFLTQHEESFLTQSKKIEKFDIFTGNFPNSNPNHKWLTRPELQKIDPIWPGSKFFDPDPSLSYPIGFKVSIFQQKANQIMP